MATGIKLPPTNTESSSPKKHIENVKFPCPACGPGWVGREGSLQEDECVGVRGRVLSSGRADRRLAPALWRLLTADPADNTPTHSYKMDLNAIGPPVINIGKLLQLICGLLMSESYGPFIFFDDRVRRL